MSLHYLIYIIKIFSFDKIQMRWIRHNSVGKQKLNNNNKKKPEKIKQKKYFAGSFKYYYLLKIANNYLSKENTKKLKNKTN